MLRAPALPSRGVYLPAHCWTRCAGSASSCPSSAWMSSRSARRMIMPTSPRHWPIEWSWRLCALLPANVRICRRVGAGIRCYPCSANGQRQSRRVRFRRITTPTSAMIRSDKTIMNDTSSEVQADTALPDVPPGTSSASEITVGTDAAYAPPAFRHTQRPLRNISEVRHFFRTNEVPIYFVGATPFNLLGLDRWVRNFCYVTYYDGWDGAHPRVFTPKHKPYIEFESGEEINNWLLVNPEVRAHMSRPAPAGQRPKVAMVFFDAETERICDELGYDLILPSAELREHLDSKLVTTRLGNDVGAASVPNV